MSARNHSTRPSLLWDVMDVRDMSAYPSNTFDLIIDKSTIDALMCGDDASMNTAKMMGEC